MLTYRGDKFIKGKKFTINESIYRFQKRDNKDNLIFEGIDGEKLKITEEEFDKSVVVKEEAVEDVLTESNPGNTKSMVETTNEIIDTTTEEVCNELYEEEAISALGLDADIWVHNKKKKKVLPKIEKAIRMYADKLKDVMKDELELISQGLK